jgi:hypothetical protein
MNELLAKVVDAHGGMDRWSAPIRERLTGR